MGTTVTSKGQVTIPKDVRGRLGIRAGSRVEFRVVGDHAELYLSDRPVEAPENGFGLLKSKRASVPADFDPATLAQRK
ncbi:AbrB/MazE/SpoVT family DNA-binding domain-containing protein [Sinimarinibacterium thermocellulolyticum]|uniref:AbrB/MazE/SpoVT family DNA-binding domain-containing protein n=1 Tax=Sinimarinibacterium thermocellulolyticum TaxID=3170016 RepID=A0ABV2ADE4_9GAMM